MYTKSKDESQQHQQPPRKLLTTFGILTQETYALTILKILLDCYTLAYSYLKENHV